MCKKIDNLAKIALLRALEAEGLGGYICPLKSVCKALLRDCQDCDVAVIVDILGLLKDREKLAVAAVLAEKEKEDLSREILYP